MIPNTPNRTGDLGVWLTPAEWARMLATLRTLIVEAERCGMIYPSVEISTLSVMAVREAVEGARETLWALTGEAVGRRGRGAGDERG